MRVTIELDDGTTETYDYAKEDHDCMLAGLRKVPKVDDDGKHIWDLGGREFAVDNPETVLNDPANEGATPVLVDDWTVGQWLDGALKGKMSQCKKRAHMSQFDG